MDLIKACKSKNTKKALGLIMNNNTNLGIVDNHGWTALIWACRNFMKEVVLELIKTGKTNPDYIAHEKTVLSWACDNNMKEVAYELVSIGQFTINDLLFLKPEWVSEELFIMKSVDVTEVDI